MTISYTTSEMAWINMPAEQKDMFNSIAYKDGNPDLDGYDWFNHLVPSELQDNPQEVEVFMNGGEVTQEVWVYDQGTNSGHYETVTHELPDRDVSRIQSGQNGGEYTPDNTVMENSSINRSRQADNMSAEDLESAQEAAAVDAELIDGGATTFTDVSKATVSEATDAASNTTATTADVVETGASAAEAGDSLLENVLEGVLPITYGAKAAHYVWKDTSDMDTQERVAVTALAGGATVGVTYTALACIPGLNIVLGGVALWKVGTAVHKWANTPATA